MKDRIFDPRQERYKRPYGAVPSGTQVEFTLRPDRAEGFSCAVLRARFEFWDNELREIPLLWQSTRLGRDEFSGKLDTRGYMGLVWYTFRLEGLDGRFRETEEYQLTVYDDREEVPHWFGEGMCYQIFPDRFFRTRVPEWEGAGLRTVHTDWKEDPEYLPSGTTPEGKDICNRDFFGGDLAGVKEKLEYLKGLGVETLYFCPLFEAAENHRYGTADYHRIDPMLGTNEEFSGLCETAHGLGMRVILDGVFNHIGYVSRYFNGDGTYPDPGAARCEDSPYRSWFRFTQWPREYESWWGIYSLPAVEENDPGYRNFIFGAEDSVVRRWVRAGADGWRLDVADELPDDFISGLRAALRRENPEAVLIGEVWEDGSTKIAYGVRRCHLLGGHLDGLMNYPFRTALLSWLLGGRGEDFREEMETLRENYPPFAFYNAMNALGTHDTLRILTCLGTESTGLPGDKAYRAGYVLTPQRRKEAKEKLKVAAAVLFAFPGAPTVYYGDEAGMEGYEDPFNRRTYPWGEEDGEVLSVFSRLGNLRRENIPLRRGKLIWGPCRDGVISFLRENEGEYAALAANRSGKTAQLTLNWPGGPARELFTGAVFRPKEGALTLTLPPKTPYLLTEMPH